MKASGYLSVITIALVFALTTAISPSAFARGYVPYYNAHSNCDHPGYKYSTRCADKAQVEASENLDRVRKLHRMRGRGH